MVKNIKIKGDKEELYWDLLDLLRDLKLTQGPLGVNSTLTRHPAIKQFIISTQSDLIKSLEKKIVIC